MLTAEATGLLNDMGPEELQGVEYILLQDRSNQGDRELRDLGVDLRPEQQEEQEQQWAGDIHRESSRSGITEHQGRAGLMNLLGVDLRPPGSSPDEQPPQEQGQEPQLLQALGNIGGRMSLQEAARGTIEGTVPSVPDQRQGSQLLQPQDSRSAQEAATGANDEETTSSVPDHTDDASRGGPR